MRNITSKSWNEKLVTGPPPKLVNVPEKWARRIGHGQMLVPSPLLVDMAVKKIPRGKLATVNILRNYLAELYRADMTCPLTTGIFLHMVANAAEEVKEKGKKKITPYWRVLKENGSLNPKFPGGIKKQAEYLKQEGFVITKRKDDEMLYVKEFDKKLVHHIDLPAYEAPSETPAYIEDHEY